MEDCPDPEPEEISECAEEGFLCADRIHNACYFDLVLQLIVLTPMCILPDMEATKSLVYKKEKQDPFCENIFKLPGNPLVKRLWALKGYSEGHLGASRSMQGRRAERKRHRPAIKLWIQHE